MTTVNGRQIDIQECGTGTPVLFMPGSFSTPKAWRGVQKHLNGSYRTISTSLCGYGETPETRSIDDFGMDHETDVVEAIAARIDEPFHLVGHSFGATVALASALKGKINILSLTTYEANPISTLRNREDANLYEETLFMSEAFEKAHLAGEVDAAARIIDFWGSSGSFAAMPDAAKAYCRATTASNVLDWRTVFSFDAKLSDYSGLDFPVLLIRGSLANPAMIEITDTLRSVLPNNRSAIVEDAGHFLITTHAETCANLLDDFISSQSS